MTGEYKLIVGGAIRLSDGLTICSDLPQIAGQWKEYQDWLNAGNKPLPADLLPEDVLVRDLAKELDDLKAETASIKADVVVLKG